MGPRRTRVLPIGTGDPAADEAAIREAADVIRRGGLVAFPTETVYGLGADATNPDAVRAIFEAKGRPATNPVIVHGDDIRMLHTAVRAWPGTAARLAQRFWPGPLTLVLPRSELVPDEVTAGLDTVGVRVPDHDVARRLAREAGRPIAAPSANRSTGVSPTTAAHVLKDLDGRLDVILDAGPTHVGIESTVLDLTAAPPRVLRPGAITAGQIGRVLEVGIEDAMAPTRAPGSGAPLTSPGQMELHYAPKARVFLAEPEQLCRQPRTFPWKIALIVAGRRVGIEPGVYDEVAMWDEPRVAERELYATLHRFDEVGVRRIDVVLPPIQSDAWRAIRDRLWRASRRWDQEGR